MDGYYNLSLKRPTNATEAYNNCISSKNWGFMSQRQTATDAQKKDIEIACIGPWIADENGNWKQVPTLPVATTTTTTQTAGFGDNKMLIWLIGGGLVLWYLNKEGYLKKILK